ncbi:MAG: hypothetical protein JW895_12085 [Thermoleophilaceae bacterium]|nr:hypothetical protein [Thermoleophilaceae bacterium]
MIALAAAALMLAGGSADSEHATARRHWREQRARDYSYVVHRSCFCLGAGPARIRVVNRRPRDTPATFENVDTARELFAWARRALRSEGEHRVVYRPRLGLPKLIDADPIAGAVDDEYSYRVTGLRITRRYPPNGG